ncbi:hypothetical protein Tco_0322697 [Tanacetum coccineum]
MVVRFCLWLGFGCDRVPVMEGHGGGDSDGGGDVGGGVVIVVVRARGYKQSVWSRVVVMIEIKRVCVVRLKMRLFALWRGELPKLAGATRCLFLFGHGIDRNERVVMMRSRPFIEYDDTRSWANVDDFLVRYPISVLFSLFNVFASCNIARQSGL